MWTTSSIVSPNSFFFELMNLFLLFLIVLPKILIQRHRPETNFADTEVAELIAMLRETEQLDEQGDILQYLFDTQGLDFNTGEFLSFQIFIDLYTFNFYT